MKSDLEKELEKSYIIKCRGNSPALDLLEEPVDVLLKVYKNGKVEVNCYYFSNYRGNCLHSKNSAKECIYKK